VPSFDRASASTRQTCGHAPYYPHDLLVLVSGEMGSRLSPSPDGRPCRSPRPWGPPLSTLSARVRQTAAFVSAILLSSSSILTASAQQVSPASLDARGLPLGASSTFFTAAELAYGDRKAVLLVNPNFGFGPERLFRIGPVIGLPVDQQSGFGFGNEAKPLIGVRPAIRFTGTEHFAAQLITDATWRSRRRPVVAAGLVIESDAIGRRFKLPFIGRLSIRVEKNQNVGSTFWSVSLGGLVWPTIKIIREQERHILTLRGFRERTRQVVDTLRSTTAQLDPVSLSLTGEPQFNRSDVIRIIDGANSGMLTALGEARNPALVGYLTIKREQASQVIRGGIAISNACPDGCVFESVATAALDTLRTAYERVARLRSFTTTLHVTSRPTGAAFTLFYYDSTQVQGGETTTDHELRGVSIGFYRALLQKAGYKSVQLRLNLSDDPSRRIRCMLTPSSASGSSTCKLL